MYRLLFIVLNVFGLDVSRRIIINTVPVAATPGVHIIPINGTATDAVGRAVKKLDTSESNNLRSIYFYGDVTVETCAMLTRTLCDIDQTEEPIHLHIQSFGGELLPTFNVIDTIERLKSPVYSYVEGYAASAATLISVCCDKRYMGQRSLMLIHQLSGTSEGTYGFMKQEMDNMNIYMDFAKQIYLSHSKLNNESLSNILLFDNKWLNSSMCLEYGLVDEILGR